MKSIIALVAFAVIFNVKSTNGQGSPAGVLGADVSKWTPFVCRDGIMGPNDDRMSGIMACAEKYGLGKSNNGDCVFFCQAIELGLLDSNGLPQTEIYDRWVEATKPERHHKLAKDWFRDCYEKFGKSIDKSDTTCKFAKQFGDCTWQVQSQLTCPNA